eukprot:8862506-Ditylum_brightwellii.AAC.1
MSKPRLEPTATLPTNTLFILVCQTRTDENASLARYRCSRFHEAALEAESTKDSSVAHDPECGLAVDREVGRKLIELLRDT